MNKNIKKINSVIKFHDHGDYKKALMLCTMIDVSSVAEPQLLLEYARVLSGLKQTDLCIQTLGRILAIGNEEFYHIVYMLLGDEYAAEVKVWKAIEYYKKSVKANEEHRVVYLKLGNMYRGISRFDEAIKYYKIALQMQPNKILHSRILMAMHYLEPYNRELIFEEHLNWGNIYGYGEKKSKAKYIKKEGAKIRIGLVSGDFYRHSVSYFLLPLLESINKDDFEFYCYSNSTHFDEITGLIQSLVKSFIVIKDVAEKDVCKRISEDQIDILIDLAGHTSRGRIGVLTHKPAPIQITYLGYPDTTGIKSVDYRIVDKYTDDELSEKKYHVEKLLYMPGCFFCFRSLDKENIFPAEDSPCKKNNYITFGSFNAVIKFNEKVIYAWAQILKRVPGSKLVLKATNIRYKDYQNNIIDMFQKNGFDQIDRIHFLGRKSSHVDHLRCYDEVDIALDTFPYNGATTTCQALSMGVPVIALKGEAHVSRVSYSILKNLGCDTLVGNSIEDYIDIAAHLARRPDAINYYRKNLRHMMNDTISNQEMFSRDFGEMLKEIWGLPL